MKISALDGWVRRTEGLPSLSRAEVEALQLRRLNALLKRERARGGFYANVPESLPELAALADLPLTTQEDLTARGGEMVLVSQAEIQRVHTFSTSGTTGPPKRLFYTREDCGTTVSFFAAGLSELVFPGGRTLICMPFSGPDGLGELIAAAADSLGAEPLRAGVSLTYGELGKLLEHHRPDTYVGMPAPLLALLKLHGPGSLRRALVSGDACVPAVMRAIEVRLGTRLFPHYGSRETALGGAVTCSAHEGMHLRENQIIAEIVDEKGRPLPRGEAGELVITTVGMGAMPLIRYRTGDYTRILPEPCPCGSCLSRLGPVTRRSPAAARMAALDQALLPLDGLVDYLVREGADGVALHALTLPGTDAGAIQTAALRALPGERVRVSARLCTERDRSLYPGKRTMEK